MGSSSKPHRWAELSDQQKKKVEQYINLLLAQQLELSPGSIATNGDGVPPRHKWRGDPASIATNSEAEVSSRMAMVATYPGGKGNCYKKIINLIPPHSVYIETHAGSAAVGLNKRPAKHNILIDINPSVTLGLIAKVGEGAGWSIITSDAARWLRDYPFSGSEFIYADPPYLFSTRKQQRPLYDFEYDDAQHLELLTLLKQLPCPVMISGYWSQMYADILSGWHTVSFPAVTRGGSLATEWLWMNYPEPFELHDYQYLGDNFRERERIKRKKARWVNKLTKLPNLERQVIMMALQESPLARKSDTIS